MTKRMSDDAHFYLRMLVAGELDRLLDLRKHPPTPEYFDKGDWRGDLHRREHAISLVQARRARTCLEDGSINLGRNECE